jgi:putative two-component system response regulator
MAEFIEFRDDFTSRHARRTGEYLKLLMEQLIRDRIYTDEVMEWDINVMLLSSQLHDVGKNAISDSILNKPGKHTPEEFAIMKSHVQKGMEAIDEMEQSSDVADFMRHARLFTQAHHEKWNGSGYPYGLSGEDIPLEGRILAIVDVYDALITERPYKKAFTHDETVQIIIDGAGTHFDPVLIATFEKLKDAFANIEVEYIDVLYQNLFGTSTRFAS